jgi:hypothetical protein
LKNPNKNNLSDYGRYSGIAFQMAVIIIAGALGGRYFDNKFHFAKPWFTIILTIISVFFAIFFAIKDFLKKD